MKRATIVAGFQLLIERPRLSECSLSIEHDPGVDLALPLIDLFENND